MRTNSLQPAKMRAACLFEKSVPRVIGFAMAMVSPELSLKVALRSMIAVICVDRWEVGLDRGKTVGLREHQFSNGA